MGELLSWNREATNTRDRYSVVVKKDGEAIGHLPRKGLRVCSLFLRRGGTVHCSVSGHNSGQTMFSTDELNTSQDV